MSEHHAKIVWQRQSADFTYQGNLQNGASPANGTYDFEFLLWDALSGGTQLGSTLARNNVAVPWGGIETEVRVTSSFAPGGATAALRSEPAEPRSCKTRFRSAGTREADCGSKVVIGAFDG